MPDHMHLSIQPHLKRYNISTILKYIKGSFALSYNKLIRKSGPIWQRRFFDTVLQPTGEGYDLSSIPT